MIEKVIAIICLSSVDLGMKDLKRYVRNRSNPEGCIAEKYLAEEITRFCSGYIKGAAEICVKTRRNEDFEDETILEGRPLGQGKLKPLSSSMLDIAHRFVWTNTSEIDPWREMHREQLKCSDTRLEHDEKLLEQRHLDTFSGWIARKVKFGDSTGMSDIVKWIACRPKADVISHTGFIINGNQFQTKAIETTTQNSGVFVEADTICRASAKDNLQKMDRVSYYGVIRDIILLDYRKFKICLFDCYWANIGTGVKVEDGFTLVNLHKGQHQFDRDPFIFASQAKQMFYSRESDTLNWHVVLRAPRRGFFQNDGVDESTDIPVDVSDIDSDSECEDCDGNDSEEMNSGFEVYIFISYNMDTAETSRKGGKRAKKQEQATRVAAAIAARERQNEPLRISNGISNSTPTSPCVESDIPEGQEEPQEDPSNPESRKVKPRGKAKLLEVGKKRKRNGPIQVEFNERGQPIGKHATNFSSFIGTSARELIPITAGTWKDVSPTFQDDI
ncbi:hypothetical protein ACLB2K_041225 [Fragaria x ananassa]